MTKLMIALGLVAATLGAGAAEARPHHGHGGYHRGHGYGRPHGHHGWGQRYRHGGYRGHGYRPHYGYHHHR